MQTTLTQAEAAHSIRRLKFPRPFESDFQQDYYSRVRTNLRIGLFLILGCAFGLLFDEPSARDWDFCGVGLISLALLVLSFRREFAPYWQPAVVGTICLSACLSAVLHQYYGIDWLYYLLTLFLALRLQVRWLVPQMLVVDVALCVSRHGSIPLLVVLSLSACLSLFLAYRFERFQRSRFAEQFLLTQERRLGQEKLEQTEKMLHVLSQAIGSIAHDLGNPLTTVHVSAETLSYLIKEDALDRKTELEFLGMITDGAKMLNSLRLSLMEQTRVLEGRPILVELQSTDVRQLVEAGARYQQPKYSTGRQITLEGDGLPLCIDEMRFVTVFMNLIGNALKYSDGEVKVTWRTDAGRVLVGVLDQGQKGLGISQAQAETLFVPFGRLDTHAQVEGTGLGLLSVRKIAEAHEGEAYIEGYHDGTADAPIFSTAQGSYPRMLQDGFCTAFVTACPLKTVQPLSTGEVSFKEIS